MAIPTISTKLLDQTLEGARIIDMGSSKTCLCFVLPKDRISDVAKKHASLKQYAFYILLGEDKTGKPMAYIGQTNDFSNRAADHKLKKDFWDTALVFISKANEIYASEVLYLEYLGWRKAKDAKNYVIENTKDILEPSVSSVQKNDMELFFDEIQFLTRFYGCSVFDTPKPKKIGLANGEEFYLRMPKTGVDATIMYYSDTKTFILKKGSLIASVDAPSCRTETKKFREKIKQDSTLSKMNGNLIEILSDFDITSEQRLPSGAACVITGRSTQGTTAFIDKNGKTFGERFPK